MAFLTFALKKLAYNATADTIPPTGHTDHATFSKQLTTSDCHQLQHHILTLSKPFTNQFNEYTILMSYWPTPSLTVLLGSSLPYLLKATLTSLMPPTVRRALCKDSHSHFTVHLQICHQIILLPVMTMKHF